MILDYYATPSALTAGSGLAALPGDLPVLVRAIQGLVVHEHFLPAYGLTASEDRAGEVHLRPIAAVLDRIRALDPRPLSKPRPPERRFVGDCRFYTLLFVAALRDQGVPARARCGFGAYFHVGKFVDHWVGEYWNGSRWVLVDPQLDEVQTGIFCPQFDPLDVPRDRFLIAGEAWARCRAGEADPADFGILDMRGLWFIASNLIRDVAALNGREMLPWDVWGGMSRDEPYSDDLLALHDKLAALSRAPDSGFAELRRLYREDARLTVPPVVFNAVRQRPETVGEL